MADIFVSYARADRALVAPLVAALAGQGWSVWWDPEITPGQEFDSQISDALDAAKAVVVVWTPTSVGSRWVRGEARDAADRGVLIPVRFGAARLPIDVRALNTTDLDGWEGDTDGAAFQNLRRAVTALAGDGKPHAAPVIGGPVTTEPPKGHSPPTTVLARKPLWIGAGLFTALLLAVLGWLLAGRPGWPQEPDRVAIMPFEAVGSDALARSFADGVADEVGSALTQSSLKVISSEPGEQLSGARRDQAARKLGAAYVLDGRVQHDASDLGLQVRLNDARRHEVLWAASFRRPASHAQAMQEEAAAKIADVLHCALHTGNFQGGRIDTTTLVLYLRACDIIHNEDSQDQVRDLLKQVVARQPNFASAWSSLAVASAAAAKDLPPDQAAMSRRDGLAAARRALRLDPKDADAYVALYDLVPPFGRFAERQAYLNKGFALQPDNESLDERESELLQEVGRIDEAADFGHRALNLDPLSPTMTAGLASLLANAGGMAEARALVERAARAWPDEPNMQATRMAIEARLGDPDRALALLDDPSTRPSRYEPWQIETWRRLILVRKSKDPKQIEAFARDELANLAAGRTTVARSVLMLANVGATNAAFTAAARATAEDPLGGDVLFRPFSADMQRDARFMPLAAKLGLVDYWRASGKWPDFCEAPNRPYDCRATAAAVLAAVKRP